MYKTLSILVVALLAFTACRTTSFSTKVVENPAAEGFNAQGSDAKAIQIADEVMNAIGGRAAWDATRYFKWNFFGRRRLLWDKWTGDVRIEWLAIDQKTITNLHRKDGKVWKNGAVATHPDTIAKYLDLANRVWVNDSYWLAMPFKMKDSGVTLKYLGEGKTADGAAADLLQLTFDSVGFTPQNKYNVWVDKTSRLVTQWAYFRTAADEQENIRSPWRDYRRYGNILLSGDRGEGRQLNEIAVLKKVPKTAFTDFEGLKWEELK
jgi:hypothetical protein